uniref:Uncharacterized protein n=1 Tax=Setaria italica TaxID=4555 RepID=K3XTZ4_SETIT
MGIPVEYLRRRGFGACGVGGIRQLGTAAAGWRE